jgi:thioredoxin-dependent peroxiredoxin
MKRFVFCIATTFAIAAFALMADRPLRGSEMDPPKVGDKAPAFEAKDETGKLWKSTDHVGKKVVVVYFYPADFTGGCTSQACGFRDNSKALEDKGVEVVGVSGDSIATHAAFKKEHKLTFTLLSDESGALADKFGVPFTKKDGKATFKGETFIRAGTAQRYTVVIGKEGTVIAHYQVKDAANDNKKVLEIVDGAKK